MAKLSALQVKQEAVTTAVVAVPASLNPALKRNSSFYLQQSPSRHNSQARILKRSLCAVPAYANPVLKWDPVFISSKVTSFIVVEQETVHEGSSL